MNWIIPVLIIGFIAVIFGGIVYPMIFGKKKKSNNPYPSGRPTLNRTDDQPDNRIDDVKIDDDPDFDAVAGRYRGKNGRFTKKS